MIVQLVEFSALFGVTLGGLHSTRLSVTSTTLHCPSPTVTSKSDARAARVNCEPCSRRSTQLQRHTQLQHCGYVNLQIEHFTFVVYSLCAALFPEQTNKKQISIVCALLSGGSNNNVRGIVS